MPLENGRRQYFLNPGKSGNIRRNGQTDADSVEWI